MTFKPTALSAAIYCLRLDFSPTLCLSGSYSNYVIATFCSVCVTEPKLKTLCASSDPILQDWEVGPGVIHTFFLNRKLRPRGCIVPQETNMVAEAGFELMSV